MPQDDLNDRLTQSLNGSPQTRPDERRRYLGSLRERVALAVSNQDLSRASTLPACQQFLADYAHQADYKLLLNGKLDVAILAPYMQLARKLDLAFTSINDDTASLASDAVGLLLVNKVAIDHPDVALPKASPEAPTKRRGFFDFLH